MLDQCSSIVIVYSCFSKGKEPKKRNIVGSYSHEFPSGTSLSVGISARVSVAACHCSWNHLDRDGESRQNLLIVGGTHIHLPAISSKPWGVQV